MYVCAFLYSFRSELTVLDGDLLCMAVGCYYSTHLFGHGTSYRPNMTYFRVVTHGTVIYFKMTACVKFR